MNAAEKREWALVQKIRKMPAKTAAGFVAKAEVITDAGVAHEDGAALINELTGLIGEVRS
jgi:hypothetical protein